MQNLLKLSLSCSAIFFSTTALSDSFTNHHFSRDHGFYLTGGTLNSLSNHASQASTGWHTHIFPDVRWGLNVTSLVNKVSPPNGHGSLSYYHVGPGIRYQPYRWARVATETFASMGFGRLGYRSLPDQQFISTGVRLFILGFNAAYDVHDRLQLSAGCQYQKATGVQIIGLGNKHLTSADVFLGLTTFR